MNPTNGQHIASESFTNTNQNRDSLTPMPSRLPGPDCVHRDVALADTKAADFSRERGHPVYAVRLPSNTVSLSIGELDPGAQTSNHRHAYESLIYVISGRGYTITEGQRYEWKAGDAVYVPPWCWHRHCAYPDESARYITATNLPMLKQLGQTVVREEER
jgi:quercetin dioxygenase-like cupin family protein